MCLPTLPQGIGRSRNTPQELFRGARAPRSGNVSPPQTLVNGKPRDGVTILSAARPDQSRNDYVAAAAPAVAVSLPPSQVRAPEDGGIASGPPLLRRKPATAPAPARSTTRLAGSPVPGPARTAGVPTGGILMRPPAERRKNLRPQPKGGTDSFLSESPSFPRVSNFGGGQKPLRPPVVGKRKSEQDRFRNNPEVFRQGERYPRADTRKGLEFWEANGELADRWLAEVSGLLTGKDRASEDGTFARKVRELGLNHQRIQIFTEALRPGADRAVILKRFEQLFAGKAPDHKKAVEGALRGILDAKTAADKTQAIRNAAFLSHADVSKGENKAPNKFRAVLNAFGAGISPAGDVAGIAAVLDHGDESRSKQIGRLLERIKRLSRLENAEERRQEATVLNRQVRELLPQTTTAALFHKAITGAALGKAPPTWLDRYAERSTILPGVARATGRFHDGLFPVDPRIENDPAVRSAGIAGEIAGLVGIGGVGAAAKAAGGLRDGGRRFIRSFDEIQQQKKSAADDLAESPDRNPETPEQNKLEPENDPNSAKSLERKEAGEERSKENQIEPWEVPREVVAKFPQNWGAGSLTRAATKKPTKAGLRWHDPSGNGSGVRIDKGNPGSHFPSQRVDHVIVIYRGKVIGRDGTPIAGAINDHAIEAHIPLSEYRTWNFWFKP